MLLVSYRWLTSYASKWGGGSKAVLASSGWLKIVLDARKFRVTILLRDPLTIPGSDGGRDGGRDGWTDGIV